jgi:hypothetical protein
MAKAVFTLIFYDGCIAHPKSKYALATDVDNAHACCYTHKNDAQ